MTALFSKIGKLFGKSPDHDIVQEFIKTWDKKPRLKKDPPFWVAYPCKEMGYQLSFKRDGEDDEYLLDSVLLEPGEFTGELPAGIDWKSSREEVHQVMGDPSYTHPKLGFDIFDLDDYSLRFEFFGDKEVSLMVLHGKGQGRPAS